MNAITQEPVSIGPVPRCVRVDDGGSTSLLLLIALAVVWAISYPMARYSELGRAIHKIKNGDQP